MGRYYRKRYYRRSSKLGNLIKLFFVGVLLVFSAPVLVAYIIEFALLVWFIKWLFKKWREKQAYSDFRNEIEMVTEEVQKEDEITHNVPYKKKSFLMTRAEYNFDKVLREAVNGKYEIERQVLLSRLVEPTTENLTDYKTGRKFNPDRSKIDKKTIDFVLYNKAGYTPYLAIELDDSSHLRADRKERDTFVEEVLSSVDIRLVRIKNAHSYDLETIAELIK